MPKEAFSCCHLYEKCSDNGYCIKDQEDMDLCGYWNRNLSKGKVFYGKNRGMKEGHIFLELGGRAFRISKRFKELTYPMGLDYLERIMRELQQLGVRYSLQAQGDCLIGGHTSNPARYQVNFVIDQYEYTIKNYNGYLLEKEAVEQIKDILGEKLKLIVSPPLSSQQQRSSANYDGYYGRETVFVAMEKQAGKPRGLPTQQTPKIEEIHIECGDPMKLPKGEELLQGKWTQMSIWDVV